jgi:hypothetical protein
MQFVSPESTVDLPALRGSYIRDLAMAFALNGPKNAVLVTEDLGIDHMARMREA